MFFCLFCVCVCLFIYLYFFRASPSGKFLYTTSLHKYAKHVYLCKFVVQIIPAMFASYAACYNFGYRYLNFKPELLNCTLHLAYKHVIYVYRDMYFKVTRPGVSSKQSLLFGAHLFLFRLFLLSLYVLLLLLLCQFSLSLSLAHSLALSLSLTLSLSLSLSLSIPPYFV